MAIERVQTPRGERTRDTETGRFVSNSIKEFADKVVDGQKAATDSIKGVVQTLQQKVGSSIVPMVSGTTEAFASDRTDPQGTMAMTMGDHFVELGDKICDEIYSMGQWLGQAVQDAATEIVDGVQGAINNLIGYEEIKDRQSRDQSTELLKESSDLGTGSGSQEEKSINPDLSKLAGEGGIAGWIAATALSMQTLLDKLIFKPFKKLFGPTSKFGRLMLGLGPLGKMLGRFGPIGLLITGLTLIIKYADELIKALTPVIDAIKVVIRELKPVFDVLLFVGDLIIKSGIAVLGAALEIAFNSLAAGIEALADTIENIYYIVKGIFTGDGDLIKEGFEGIKKAWTDWFNNVIEIVSNALTGLGNTLGEIFGIEDFNEKMKEKFVDVFSPLFASVQGIIDNITSIFSGDDILKNLGELAFNLNDVIMWPINQAIILIGNMFGWDGTYDGEPFTVQGWAADKISEIWEKIKSFFTFDLPELPKFELPSFSEIFDGIVGAILPSPDNWFGRQFYKLFPDLKTVQAGAVSTTNVSNTYKQVAEHSATEIDKSVEYKDKVMTMGATTNIGTVNNYVNANSGNVDSKNVASKIELAAVNLKKEPVGGDPWGDASG